MPDDDADPTTDTAPDAPGTGSRPAADPGSAGRGPPSGWLDAEAPLEVTLPADLQRSLGRLLGEEPVATLGDWVDAVRRHAGGAVGVDDLCHAAGETPHRGDMDGETYHFQCFYDAVVLAALADAPVEIRTESPDGTVIEAVAGPAALQVTPETAAFSFGVDERVVPPAGSPSPAAVYGAVCPYVRAFPDRAAYGRWATDVPAATVAMPLDGAIALARALVG